MKLGAHVSLAGEMKNSIMRGQALGCEVIQIFTSNPRGWAFKERAETEISDFKELADQAGIKAYGHAIYLTNLASNNPLIYTNSINSLLFGAQLAEKADLRGIITHVGSHGGDGVEKGVERVVNALKQVLDSTTSAIIMLETDAGSGFRLGTNFEEIGSIIKQVGNARIKVCLDTCHVFAAGYDLSTKKGLEAMISEFDQKIGLDRLAVLHLNDSKTELGSQRDRHEEIGKGFLGAEAFERIVNHPKLKHLDGIVETPDNKGEEGEAKSLEILKGLRK